MTANEHESMHTSIFDLPPSKRFKASSSPLPVIEQERFNYNFIPTLQHIARVEIALSIWNNSEIRIAIQNFFSSSEYQNVDSKNLQTLSVQWRQITANAVLEIKQLPLPKSLTELLICNAECIGESIAKWMIYCDKMIFMVPLGMPSKAKEYLDQLKWTSRGAIDYQKTAKAIIAQNRVSNREKYLLACTFCLKNEIKTFAQDIRNLNVFKRNRHAQPMAWYWTFAVQYKVEELQEGLVLSGFDTIYDCLLDLILFSAMSMPESTLNDPAMKFVWTKLSERSREKLANVSSFSPEFYIFLLSQTNESFEKKILAEMSDSIFSTFIKNNLWIDHITSIALHVMQYSSEESYSEIIKTLHQFIKYYRKHIKQYPLMYRKYVEIFYEVWQNSPSDYKSDIFERDDHLGARVIYALSWEISADVVRSIFSAISPVQRKDVLESKYGIKKSVHLITTDQKTSFDEFLSFGFTNEQDIDEFKKNLMKKERRQIFSLIKTNNGWTGVKEFIQWFFKISPDDDDKLWNHMEDIMKKYCDNDEDIYKDKAQLLIYYLCDESFAHKYSNEETKVSKITEFLDWYFKPLNKHLLSENDQYLVLGKLLHFLILDCNYSLADLILNFLFADPQLLMNFKNKFFSLVSNENLIFNFITKRDNFESLQNYVNWCFDDADRRNLNEYFLYLDYFVRLLKANEFELIDNYIEWLKLTKQEIVVLKKLLMQFGKVNDVDEKISNHEINELEYSAKLRKLVSWIDPSEEAMALFFDSYEEQCSTEMFRILNNLHDKERGFRVVLPYTSMLT